MSQSKKPEVTKATVNKGVKRVFGVLAAAAVVYACIFLFMQNQAQAAEGDLPDAPAVEEVAEDLTEDPVEDAPAKGSRFSQAFDLIFKGDAREIVAEANAELEQRIAAADAREAEQDARDKELEALQLKLGEQEAAVAELRDITKAQHEALTNCVLHAMKGADKGGDE